MNNTHTSNTNGSLQPLRRKLLAAGAGVGLWITAIPALSAPDTLEAAIKAYTGGAAVKRGRVKLEVPELVDNGNAVPLTVTVDSPMSSDNHVVAIAIFNEKNPERDIARFTLGPRAGKARIATRIRLADTQSLVAVARMSDGSYWSHTVHVVVTLAACLEGEA